MSGAGIVANRKQQLLLAARALDAVSPLATLERGYSIVSDAASGRILTDVNAVKEGAKIHAQLARGTFQATVNKTENGSSDD